MLLLTLTSLDSLSDSENQQFGESIQGLGRLRLRMSKRPPNELESRLHQAALSAPKKVCKKSYFNPFKYSYVK